MNARIEQANNLAFDHDRVRNIDHIIEHARKAKRDGGLAVSGRSIAKNGASGSERRPALFDEAVRESEPPERLADVVEGDQLVRDLLKIDALVEILKSDGRRPWGSVLLHCITI